MHRISMSHSWITDGSSTVCGFSRYAGADEFAQTVASRYRHDYWAEADESVQIWVKKDAMVGVVRPVTDEFGLDLYVTRGFASVTNLQEAAEELMDEERPVYIYLLTDYDPAGLSIADKVSDELPDRSGNCLQAIS